MNPTPPGLLRDPPPLPASAALFIDFDGTLAPIAPRPQDVRVPGWVMPTLERLRRELDGALAIVSGRPLAQIDALLHPLVLPAAGTHGAERRDALGRIEVRRAEPPAEVVRVARELAGRFAGLLLETKLAAIAIHYRLRPEMERLCREALSGAMTDAPDAAADWELLAGHCVFELKQRAVSKGTAVNAYLAEPPFAARLPVFVGDDRTDEDGIRAAQAAGGFGVRVGAGETQALYRLADSNAVERWLHAAAPATHSHE